MFLLWAEGRAIRPCRGEPDSRLLCGLFRSVAFFARGMEDGEDGAQEKQERKQQKSPVEDKKQRVRHGGEEGDIHGLNLGEKRGHQGQEAGEKKIDPSGVEDLEGVLGDQGGGDATPVEGQGAEGEKNNKRGEGKGLIF